MASDTPTVRYNRDPDDQASDGTPQGKWWLVPESKSYIEIFSVVKWIRENQNYRQIANLRYARLYQNVEVLGLQAYNFARTNNIKNMMTNRVTYNVIKSCVDTATAKIGKEKPRPLFLTEKGNWQQQEKGKKLTQYIDGQFDLMDMYATGRECFRDATVFGTGIMKLFKKDYAVHCERVMPDEIIVDDTEGIYGEPRQLHQIKNVDRAELAAMFPDQKDLIAKVKKASNLDKSGYSSKVISDLVTVVESWHLPSSPTSKDGRHCISVDNATLLYEDYGKNYFPFAVMRWHKSILGFFGVGLAEELIGIQLEMNKLLRTIQIAQHLIAVPRIWLEETSRVAKANINNAIGGMNYYRGQKPIIESPGAVAPEIYQHLENLWNKAFDITGISQMNATSEKPSGVDSAIGMRTLNDIASQRFTDVQQSWEDFYICAAEQVVELTQEIQEDLKERRGAGEEVPQTLEVKVQGSDFMKSIKWSEVWMPKDAYVLRCFPTGILPSEPAGKMQKVMEMVQAGFYDHDEALSLLDFPDLKQVNSRKTSGSDIILKILDKMLEDGYYIAPEPYMNLDLAQRLTQARYNQAQVDNAPEDYLELLRQFQEDVKALQDAARAEAEEAAAAAQAMAGPEVLPEGAPGIATPDMVPPESDITGTQAAELAVI